MYNSSERVKKQRPRLAQDRPLSLSLFRSPTPLTLTPSPRATCSQSAQIFAIASCLSVSRQSLCYDNRLTSVCEMDFTERSSMRMLHAVAIATATGLGVANSSFAIVKVMVTKCGGGSTNPPAQMPLPLPHPQLQNFLNKSYIHI